MKKQMTKILFSCILSLLLCNSVEMNVSAEKVNQKNEQARAGIRYDSHSDDPVPGKLDKDDFETVEEWEAYLQQHPEERKRGRYAVVPENCVEIGCTLKYTVTGLPIKRAIQRCYVEKDYIYVTQRKDATIYLSRCKINETNDAAAYVDGMVLNEFAHGQTLESFVHNGKTYFWISCKPNTDNTNLWALQVGRMEYVPGQTLEDYTGICRFSDLNYANKEGTAFGNVKRVDAALSSDESKLLLWVQNTENGIQYSYYNTNVLNNLLDEKEAELNKYVSFKDNAVLKSACHGSFQQITADDRILPNDSFQGLEFSNAGSIYIVGGKTGEQPRMSIMKVQGSAYQYESLVTFTNEIFDDQTEIEGIQLSGNEIYFGICDHEQKKQRQFIYAVNKNDVDTATSDHAWDEGTILIEPTCEEAGKGKYTCTECGAVKEEIIPAKGHTIEIQNAKDATCTENGYSGDEFCTVCKKVVKKGTEITAIGHQFGDWVVIKEPTEQETGLKERTCTICKYKESKEIPVLNHEHAYSNEWKHDAKNHWKECACGDKTEESAHNIKLINQKDATCTEDGYTGDKICTICDAMIETGKAAPATGHNFDEGKVTKEPACEEEGTKTYTCKNCHFTKSETIPAIGHGQKEIRNQAQASCEQDGYTGDTVCIICDKVIEKGDTIRATGHRYGEAVVINEPTCTEAGKKSKHCVICNARVEVTIIPELGHHYGNWVVKRKPTALVTGIERRTCTTCGKLEQKVTKKLPAFIKLNAKTIPLKVKQNTTAVKVSMQKGDRIKYWKSDKPKIASVDKKGKITGRKSGTAQITIALESGKKTVLTVKVQKSSVKTTKIVLNARSVSLRKGKTFRLRTALTPITSVEKVKFYTSNSKVVTVSSKGTIKAKKNGKATITVRAGKKKTTCKVTVK